MTRSPDPFAAHACTRAAVQGHEVLCIDEGWEAATSPPGLHPDARALQTLKWLAARVPGTAAGAMRDAGLWEETDSRDFDAEDWWFRTPLRAAAAGPQEQVVLHVGGIATVAEVYLNGELILASDSMFATHWLDVGALLRGSNELAICCRALAPLLAQRRRPRARWRTRLVRDGNLRFFRTMLLGRTPGFAPAPAAVGPWRELRLERRRGLTVQSLRLQPSVAGGEGSVTVHARLRVLGPERPTRIEAELRGPEGSGSARAELTLAEQEDAIEVRGVIAVADVAHWWPHTHGEPNLYRARLIVALGDRSVEIDAGSVGFRTLSCGAIAAHDPERDGLDLRVNGTAVFARGAVWTPIDWIGLAPGEERLRAALEQARDAGMNMLRIPGTSAYESERFYDLCDELGILVWQDFMFANLDYPISEESFRATVRREAEQVLALLRDRPSTAVLCGNSEIEQQVAMLGLDPALGRGELFGELLPEMIAENGLDAVYLPSAPCGGDRPFQPERGVANYYGVGGYRRPLEDARRAEVRFAAECLAFANVPNEAILEEMLPHAPRNLVVHHPRWKAGVPRDAGSGWDFEDVRDHYLAMLFELDPAELRRVDHERYMELSRLVSGEVMAEVFGEWRRMRSPCAGGLVLWMRDLLPGAGWGVVDARGEPKVAYHHLRRALAPSAVWLSDEGLAGMVAHVANDGPKALRADLRVALYRDCEALVEQAREPIELAPRSAAEWNLESLLGRFVDVSWAYRFGAPQQDLVVASLEAEGAGGPRLISQAMRFPAGRPKVPEAAARLGLGASASMLEDGTVRLRVSSGRLAYGVRTHVPGFTPSEDSFNIEPGGARLLCLRPRTADASFRGGALSAINLRGTLAIAAPQPEQAAGPKHEGAAPALSSGEAGRPGT